MRKIIASFALVALLSPGIAAAHEKNRGLHLGWLKNGKERPFDRPEAKVKGRIGIVTAVGADGFTLRAKDGSAWTVVASADTKITTAFGAAIALAGIKVGDNASAGGSVNGNVISARRVVVWPQNTHPAAARGTVSAKTDNTITLSSEHRGVPYQVTVNTDANTEILKSDGSAGSMADVTVGAKVSVKGLWDEVKNVLNAIEIRLF